MRSKLSVLGLFNYDNTIFGQFMLPDGVDKDTVVNSILIECADLEVLYPVPSILKTAIGLWSSSMLPSWERILRAITEEYNPIHNYDRHEEWTDRGQASGTEHMEGGSSGQSSGSNSGQHSATTTGQNSSTVVTKVAGFDSGELTNKDSTTTTGTDSNSLTETDSATNSATNSTTTSTDGRNQTNEQNEHAGHIYGNIGVTTSAAMVSEEVKLRQTLNMTDIILNDFKKRFCLLVY